MKVLMFVYNSYKQLLPCLKEVVEGHGLGCTFDREEPESIAAAINAVITHEQRYGTMRRNAL